MHMGNCAEQCAKRHNFTREQQDAYAAESFRRANAALADGSIARDIQGERGLADRRSRGEDDEVRRVETGKQGIELGGREAGLCGGSS